MDAKERNSLDRLDNQKMPAESFDWMTERNNSRVVEIAVADASEKGLICRSVARRAGTKGVTGEEYTGIPPGNEREEKQRNVVETVRVEKR